MRFYPASSGYQMTVERRFPVKLHIMRKYGVGGSVPVRPHGMKIFFPNSGVSISDISRRQKAFIRLGVDL